MKTIKGLLAATMLTAAAGTLPGVAQAAVVTVATNISVPNNFDGIYINFVTGATGSSGSTTPGYDFDVYNSGSGLTFFFPGSGAGVVTTADRYRDLAAGAVVSNTSSFANVSSAAAFRTTGTHVLGVRFLNETTNATNYGYVTLSTTATSGFPATILGYSYENTGAAITVAGSATPAVPEPATWAMMLLGFGMIGAAARKRKVNTTVSFA